MEFSYETIKQLAKDTGCKVTDLIALAAQNDPFYQGTPATLALAEWFAALYYRMGWNSDRNHIRRCHYQIVALEVNLPNGKPYENTMECWDTLLIASKAARYLKLVDIAAFDDRRNDDPISYVPAEASAPAVSLYDYLYSSDLELPSFPDLPSYSLDAYQSAQRYHIELWCEKTTINDVLLPLCQRYGLVLQTGAGELSITATRLLAERLQTSGKPARIFYISDFDPAGQSMPVAVSRKLEYFVRNDALEVDVRLFPVVLTAEQVQRYRLPRTPIKETERRKESFEAQHGTGAVELDSLVALRRGELQRILVGYIERYYDASLDERTAEARAELERTLRMTRREVLDQHREEIEAVQAELEAIRAELGPRMQQYGQHLSTLWQALSDDLRAATPDVDDYPLPDAREAQEIGDGLYNSHRDYLGQIEAYKAFQRK
jgi:hypothetical protein